MNPDKLADVSREVDDAADSLREVGVLTEKTRLASRSRMTGLPFIGWGIAWTIGLPALELLDGELRIVVVAFALLVGMLSSWGPTRVAIRTGTERRLQLCWWVLFLASPILANVGRPESFVYGTLVVGAVWAVAMCLYAIATDDWACAAVAGACVVVAGIASIQSYVAPLLLFGVYSGLSMVGLGLGRVLRSRCVS